MGHSIDGSGMWEFIIWIIALDAKCIFTLASRGKGDMNQSVGRKKKKQNFVYPEVGIGIAKFMMDW